MKKLIILMSVLFFIVSCTSVRKLVDGGRYDDAIIYSIRKLKGKKNKKTKYVEGIERAFVKVTKDDLNRISFLKEDKSGNYWAEILEIARNMNDRQNRINPLLPLISKDGYKANFKFVRVEPIIINAKKEASEYYYQDALMLLKKAKAGNKSYAREAFDNLTEIKKFQPYYKDSEHLINVAYNLGLERVLIDVKNLSNVILPRGFYDEIKGINTAELDEHWLKFYTEEDDVNKAFDYRVNLNIRTIDISGEKETVKEFEESKEVVDGFKYILDEKGNVKKDSLGNDMKEDKYVEIKAKIIELFRFKSARVRGDIKIKNLVHKRTYKSVPVNVEAVYESYASRFEGNKKALSKKSKERLKSQPEPFPANGDLLLMAVEDLKKMLLSEINRNLK